MGKIKCIIAVLAVLIVVICAYLVFNKKTEKPIADTSLQNDISIDVDENTESKDIDNDSTKRKLTIDELVTISKKQDQVEWADFKDFSYIETGSGLYIRVYEIDDMFSLHIGSAGYDENPAYMFLFANDYTEEIIDIRKEDVQAFIDAHKDNPVIKKIGYHAFLCPVDNTADNYSNMIKIGGIPPKASLSSVLALPTVRILSLEELERFKNELSVTMDFDNTYEDTYSFNEIIGYYDEKYFEENSLILVYGSTSTSAARLNIKKAAVSENTLVLQVEYSNTEGEWDTEIQGWLLCVGVAKKDIKDVTCIDAPLKYEFPCFAEIMNNE